MANNEMELSNLEDQVLSHSDIEAPGNQAGGGDRIPHSIQEYNQKELNIFDSIVASVRQQHRDRESTISEETSLDSQPNGETMSEQRTEMYSLQPVNSYIPSFVNSGSSGSDLCSSGSEYEVPRLVPQASSRAASPAASSHSPPSPAQSESQQPLIPVSVEEMSEEEHSPDPVPQLRQDIAQEDEVAVMEPATSTTIEDNVTGMELTTSTVVGRNPGTNRRTTFIRFIREKLESARDDHIICWLHGTEQNTHHVQNSSQFEIRRPVELARLWSEARGRNIILEHVNRNLRNEVTNGNLVRVERGRYIFRFVD